MRIVLVRHGQPEWVRDGLNVVDPPLNERGMRQAQRTAEVLRRETFDEIIVSPLLRARQTAAPLLDAFADREVVEPWLEEIREPNWHGTPQELAAKAYEEERNRRGEDRWTGLEGGEAPRDFVERVRAGATDWLRARGIYRSQQILPIWHSDDTDWTVCVVAHAGTNGVLLSLLLGLDPVPWEWDRWSLNHASITRLTTLRLGDGHTFSLTRLSEVEHLDLDDRTL